MVIYISGEIDSDDDDECYIYYRQSDSDADDECYIYYWRSDSDADDDGYKYYQGSDSDADASVLLLVTKSELSFLGISGLCSFSDVEFYELWYIRSR